jgi:lipopolysaccharide/colanic/teichoic acid biosynthesis glycosyltransferase
MRRSEQVVKPGMVGPFQDSGRGDLDRDDRIRLELNLIEHHSLWRDALILAHSISAVLSGKGAY